MKINLTCGKKAGSLNSFSNCNVTIVRFALHSFICWIRKNTFLLVMYIVGIHNKENPFICLHSALIAMLFPSQKEPAFANFHAWRSLGYAITFVNASYMCISTKLIVCMTFASVGTVLYMCVELKEKVGCSDYHWTLLKWVHHWASDKSARAQVSSCESRVHLLRSYGLLNSLVNSLQFVSLLRSDLFSTNKLNSVLY